MPQSPPPPKRLGVDLGLLGPDEEGENEAASDKDGVGMKSPVVRGLQG